MKLITNGLGEYFELHEKDTYKVLLKPIYSWHDEDITVYNIFWYYYSFRDATLEEMLETMSLDLYEYVMIDTK